MHLAQYTLTSLVFSPSECERRTVTRQVSSSVAVRYLILGSSGQAKPQHLLERQTNIHRTVAPQLTLIE
jgi:hypothetical protein